MSKKQADESQRLTDKASKTFEVSEGYTKGAESVRQMSRSEAVEALPEQVVKEEKRARPELEVTTDPEAAKYIGEVTTEGDAWELLQGDA